MELQAARRREEALKATHAALSSDLESELRNSLEMQEIASQKEALNSKHAEAHQKRLTKREEIARRRQQLEEDRRNLFGDKCGSPPAPSAQAATRPEVNQLGCAAPPSNAKSDHRTVAADARTHSELASAPTRPAARIASPRLPPLAVAPVCAPSSSSQKISSPATASDALAKPLPMPVNQLKQDAPGMDKEEADVRAPSRKAPKLAPVQRASSRAAPVERVAMDLSKKGGAAHIHLHRGESSWIPAITRNPSAPVVPILSEEQEGPPAQTD